MSSDSNINCLAKLKGWFSSDEISLTLRKVHVERIYNSLGPFLSLHLLEQIVIPYMGFSSHNLLELDVFSWPGSIMDVIGVVLIQNKVFVTAYLLTRLAPCYHRCVALCEGVNFYVYKDQKWVLINSYSHSMFPFFHNFIPQTFRFSSQQLELKGEIFSSTLSGTRYKIPQVYCLAASAHCDMETKSVWSTNPFLLFSSKRTHKDVSQFRF